MGNIQTKQNEKSLSNIIDEIASKYIRSQNFNDMKNLSKLEYCDKLIILTSKIINKYLDETDVKFLSQKKGITGESMTRERVMAINRDSLDSYDISNTVKKRRICIGLAKYYVQIANLFAAIATTINPLYSYIDKEGEETTVGLKEKDTIPDNANPKISRSNFCSSRVAALLNNQDLSAFEDSYKKGNVTLNPNICEFNCSTCPAIKTVNEEPGIPELEKLYYDKYDYDTGEFIGMTPDMAKLYEKNVKDFYKTFTGNDSVPETVQKFSDIKLKDYFSSVPCQNGNYTEPIVGKPSNTAFFNYIENIRSMLDAVNKYHNTLLDILNEIFIYETDNNTNETTIVISPYLTDKRLEELTKQTIEIINNLYISCEVHYTNGVRLYTNLAKKQLLNTSISQINNLNTIKDNIAAETNYQENKDDINEEITEADKLINEAKLLATQAKSLVKDDISKSEMPPAPPPSMISPSAPEMPPEMPPAPPPSMISPSAPEMPPEMSPKMSPEMPPAPPPSMISPSAPEMPPAPPPSMISPSAPEMPPAPSPYVPPVPDKLVELSKNPLNKIDLVDNETKDILSKVKETMKKPDVYSPTPKTVTISPSPLNVPQYNPLIPKIE